MKKLFYLFMVAVMFLSVQACKEKEAEATDETATEEVVTDEATEEAAPAEEPVEELQDTTTTAAE
ncbi:MAG: hypothetical protein K1X55_17990 [Chitinophagales bacterium]|nr:hypothetical protein [Chitinophagales bacterium]